MTIREKIEKQTDYYDRDMKISLVLLVPGAVGLMVLILFDPFAKNDQIYSVWSAVCVGSAAVLYGLGGFGAFAFTIIARVDRQMSNVQQTISHIEKRLEILSILRH